MAAGALRSRRCALPTGRSIDIAGSQNPGQAQHKDAEDVRCRYRFKPRLCCYRSRSSRLLSLQGGGHMKQDEVSCEG